MQIHIDFVRMIVYNTNFINMEKLWILTIYK